VAGEEFKAWQVGPYRALPTIGYHELLATRWHNQHEAAQSEHLFEMNIEALVMRYRQLKVKPSVNYIQIIKNYGSAAGASLEHPHHQIFTTPVLPDDVHDMLRGAERYAAEHTQDVFSDLLEFERREGVRVVAENASFVALCPFASRVPFEVWIVPRKPSPFFDDLDVGEQHLFSELLQNMIRRIVVGLNDPSYNYVIHSAPCDETGFVCDLSVFQNYRWHTQIFPRLNTWGGFEFGTGLEINTVLPEEAADYLRGVDTTGTKEVA
jgi:UDPglucose--hexose-1-phosphate uridylyltransferase